MHRLAWKAIDLYVSGVLLPIAVGSMVNLIRPGIHSSYLATESCSDQPKDIYCFIRETASRIAQIRLSRGLTQLELSRQMGMSRAQLARIEAGSHNITLATLFRISSALQVSPSNIVSSRRIDPNVILDCSGRV